MKIFFVRHAQTIANRDGIIQGQMNTSITEEGLERAKKMAVNFKNINIDAFYSSPIERAMITARFIADASGFKKEKIITNPFLKEINLEPWVYRKISELDYSDTASSYKTYKNNPSLFVPLSGESVYDVRKRMSLVYEQILSVNEKSDIVVVVSHSMAIRTLLTYIEEKDIDSVWEYHILPLSIIEIDYNGKKSKLIKIKNSYN